MIRLSSCVLAALALSAGIASSVVSARADDHPLTVPNLPVASVSDVASISPVNVAGLLNYCIEVELVSHDDGDSVQTALNTKTNAVPSDQTGNMDYAIGSAGQLSVNGKASTITPMDTAGQGKMCSAVLTRAKSPI